MSVKEGDIFWDRTTGDIFAATTLSDSPTARGQKLRYMVDIRDRTPAGTVDDNDLGASRYVKLGNFPPDLLGEYMSTSYGRGRGKKR